VGVQFLPGLKNEEIANRGQLEDYEALRHMLLSLTLTEIGDRDRVNAVLGFLNRVEKLLEGDNGLLASKEAGWALADARLRMLKKIEDKTQTETPRCVVCGVAVGPLTSRVFSGALMCDDREACIGRISGVQGAAIPKHPRGRIKSGVVRCVDTKGYHLTINKIYKILNNWSWLKEPLVSVEDDAGQHIVFDANCFEDFEKNEQAATPKCAICGEAADLCTAREHSRCNDPEADV
jgi:hypothetical protein